MVAFGFIITRHVNSHKTNKYWIRSVTLINTIYPDTPIIIIDDNSNVDFLTDATLNLKNLTIVQSEYPGRGELLPFIYLLKHRWFDSAVIMHDSVFVHKKINFESGIKFDVMPLWHFPYNNPSGQDDFRHIMHISSFLANAPIIQKKLKAFENNNMINSMSLATTLKQDTNIFNLCFGVQTFIKLPFLDHLEKKYKITNLIRCIKCRRDRCALERIMGCLFHTEIGTALNKNPSVFGHILSHKNAYTYAYPNYMQDVARKKIPGYFVKVWSGR